MENSLHAVLIFLTAAVLVVILCRQFKLPAMPGYLLVGLLIGPHGLALIADNDDTRALAEFGVVFLMFSIGLEFSLSKLMTMRRTVFGLGASQVVATVVVVAALSVVVGADWRAGIVLGGAFAMSSTAIVSKMLADRLELNSVHGRQVIGVLLFQDLAVVPLLILVPALAGSPAEMAPVLMLALGKAAFVLAILLYFGQRPMRAWFHLVATQKSSELFVLNVLLITLGLAFITEEAGLSLALGAFVAGMLISETEYRYQVEDDIKPFRDVLLGLFFATVGMRLDLALLAEHALWVAGGLVLLIGLKAILIAALGRFGAGRRIRFCAVVTGGTARLRAACNAAVGAGGDGAVDAGSALYHRAQRTHCPAYQRRRLAGAIDGTAHGGGAVNGGQKPCSHLRLWSQRPKPCAIAAHRKNSVYRARFRSGACSRCCCRR